MDRLMKVYPIEQALNKTSTSSSPTRVFTLFCWIEDLWFIAPHEY